MSMVVCMSDENKPAIVIYTGHNELIGGDVHYAFDLVNKLVNSGYNVKILTDHNNLFSTRADAWLKVELPIEFLDTSPKLFTPHFLEQFYSGLEQADEQQKLSGLKKVLYRLLSVNLGSSPVHWYLKVLVRLLTLTYIRGHIKNFKLFTKVMKKPEHRDAVFHFNNGGFPAKVAGLWALWAAKRAGVKRIIMTVHNIAGKRRLPIDIIYDTIARNCCDLIITASDQVKSELLHKRNIPPHLCRTIRCGMEDAEQLDDTACLTKLRELEITPGQPVLLITGNYEEERKGHRPLLRALAIVKQQFPDVLLLIVGSGSEERKALLDSEIEQLSIKENVCFLGYRTDILALNCIANICLTPSTGVESIPYTIIEGARMATPVITTTMGGCSEAVIDGESGCVVVPGDVNMLADKISFLLADPALQERMGGKGRELFLERFLLDKRAEEHFGIYAGN